MKDTIKQIAKLIEHHKASIKTLEELKQTLAVRSQGAHDEISINANEFIILKNLYGKAVKEGRKMIEFKGHTLVTDYAGYMIEFYNGKFDDARR
ncbi:MAG: hypothetical protein DRI24_20035 [Deltaproteobacteria bacterium]|nr:MAG: hypothetical protein DRI24_20035 [Deltaproteobacteria bacterium]